jgi:membrane-associated phospholipid phosphatase
MNSIKDIFQRSKLFLIPYLILFLVNISILCFYDKSSIHIWTNKHNNLFFDYFFSLLTNLGDGLFVIAVVIVLLFYRYGHSILVFSTYAISGLLVQFLKLIVFASSPRPKHYFDGLYNLHFVKGVDMLYNYSFPSGHSASAFAMLLCLSFFTKNKILKLLCFVMACLIAYSRVYLSQHFLIDAVAGSAIGIIVVLIYYYFHLRINGKWMNNSLRVYFSNKNKREI